MQIEDLGINLSEFKEPPIPEKSEGAYDIVTEKETPLGAESAEAKGDSSGGGSSEAPYTEVPSTVEDEHPYASVKVKKDSTASSVEDAAHGYDRVGDKLPSEESQVCVCTCTCMYVRMYRYVVQYTCTCA